MGQSGPEAKQEQTLRLFKRRADDLLGCELAGREDALQLGQRIHMTLVIHTTTGEREVKDVRLDVPPKEQVSYALTLIRPLTLSSDRLSWRKVLTALERFRPKEDRLTGERLAQLRTSWEAYPQPRLRVMQAPLHDESIEPTVDAWDNEIARNYLYGDLVHGDDNSAMLDALGSQQVMFAVGAMVSDGLRHVNNTYQILHVVRPDIAPDPPRFSVRASERAT